jgi:uncharacterized protein YcbX
MRVLELWRFPVKSLQGERIEAVELGPRGLEGDRSHAIFDVATGLGLTARRVPEMLFAAARIGADGRVEITLPDGSVAVDDAALSDWLGREVALRSVSEVRERRYENPADTETEAESSWFTFEGSDGAFHDSVAVTVLSTGTLGDGELRRFRPNVLVAGDGEDALVGVDVRIGAATLSVSAPVPRCVMVTRAQPGGIGIDRNVLRRIHGERGGNLSVGGAVTSPGAVRVGDEVARVSGPDGA